MYANSKIYKYFWINRLSQWHYKSATSIYLFKIESRVPNALILPAYSSLSNKYSTHVYQILLLLNYSFWNQPLNSKKKLTEHQQRKYSYWLLFKKTHRRKKIWSIKKWTHNFCTGVWTNIILSISCTDVRSIYKRYNDFKIQ